LAFLPGIGERIFSPDWNDVLTMKKTGTSRARESPRESSPAQLRAGQYPVVLGGNLGRTSDSCSIRPLAI
jgi:hypothetical protein